MQSLRILISSPGDVADERDRARQVVESLRRRYVGRLSLKPVLWEDLPLQANMSFQQGIDLVLSQGHGIDIAIFILWSRLGSPLGQLIRKPDGSEYRSGTEREFDLMVRAQQAAGGERPALLVYTRNDNASFEERLRGKPTSEQQELLANKSLVERFIREEFQDRGGGLNVRAYHSFARPVAFSTRLRAHLTELLDELAGGTVTETVWDIVEQGPPFMGLDPFQRHSANVFFGREAETLEARHALREQARNGCAFLLLSGASGSGKSSLARAGVLPEIESNELDEQIASWRTIIATPSELAPDPLASLVRLMAEDDVLPEVRGEAGALDDLVSGLRRDPGLAIQLRIKDALIRASARLGGGVRILLLLDQLEELFASAAISDTHRSEFLDAVEALARSGSVWVLATVRSDFSGQVQGYAALVRMQEGHGLIPVLPPDADALRRIIEEPARMAGLHFEERDGQSLAGRILADATAHAELLPLLEYVLRELYEKRNDQGALLWQTYEQLDGVEGALAKRAEAVYLALPADSQEALGSVLETLITLGQNAEASTGSRQEERIIRQRASRSMFADQPSALRLVDQFVAERLFTTSGDGGEATVTVAHEALLRVWPRAAAWAEHNRDFLRVRARIAARMKESSPLLEGDPLLDSAKAHLAGRRAGFTQPQRDFIETSLRQLDIVRQRRARLRRNVMAGLGALAVIAVIGALVAGLQWREARAKQRMAEKETERADTERDKAKVMLAEAAQSDCITARDQAEQGRYWDSFAHLARACDYDPESSIAAEQAVLLCNTGQFHTPLAILSGHEDGVTDARFSSDGTRVVTVSYDKTARVWDSTTGKLLVTLSGHDKRVISAEFSSDGMRVVTASVDSTARVWNAATGRTLATLSGHGGPVRSAEFSSDGARVLTASDDNTARVWDAATGEPLATLSEHEGGVTNARFSPDGARVVTASSETARVWDIAKGKTLAVLSGHEGTVTCAGFSPDGTLVVTGSHDADARVWDAESGKALATFSGHRDSVWSAEFSPDGTRVVTASFDTTARIWDVAEAKLLATLSGHEAQVHYARFSSDGMRVVTASDDKTARVWDAATGKPLATLSGHQDRIMTAQFSLDGARLVTASLDTTARVWDAGMPELAVALLGHKDRVNSARFSSTGARVVTASSDMTARVWDAVVGRPLATCFGHEGRVDAAVFSPDGLRVVTASSDMTARVWDAATGKPLATLSGHEDEVNSVGFSPDGTRVVTTSGDKTARVWDAATSALLTTLAGHERGVYDAQFSPDGTHVATDSDDTTVRVWAAAGRKLLFTLSVHDNIVSHAQFSPDGARILCTCTDNTARVSDAETGELLFTLAGPDIDASDAPVSDAQFSPDGMRIVTASSTTAWVWNAATGKLVSTISGNERDVEGVRFSPDGMRVVTVLSHDPTARIWDAATGRELGALSVRDTNVYGAQFSPDGARILTEHSDGTVRVWEVLGTVRPPPRWFSHFLRVVAVRTLNASGELANLPPSEWLSYRTEVVDAMKSDTTRYGDIARYYLTPGPNKSVRPGAKTTCGELADALITPSATRAELERAYAMHPAHPLIQLALARDERDARRVTFLRAYALKSIANAPAADQPSLRRRSEELLSASKQ